MLIPKPLFIILKAKKFRYRNIFCNGDDKEKLLNHKDGNEDYMVQIEIEKKNQESQYNI